MSSTSAADLNEGTVNTQPTDSNNGHPSPLSPAAPTPPGVTSGLHLVALLKAIRRRWAIALGVGILLAAAAASAVWLLLPPPKPNAYAKLYMPMSMKMGTVFEHPDPPLERQTQVALIKSRLVLAAALRPPEINRLDTVQRLVDRQEDPVEWLEKSLEVNFPDGPEIIRIALSGDDGEDVRKLVDAVKDSYLRDVVNRSVLDRHERLRRLTDIAAKAKEAYDRQHGMAERLAKQAQLNSVDPKSLAFQQQFAQEQLRLAQKELVQVRADLRRMRTEEGVYQNRNPAPAAMPTEVIDGYVENDAMVKALVKRQSELEGKQNDIRDRAKDPENVPAYRDLIREQEENRKQLEGLRKQLRPKVEARLGEKLKGDSTAHLVHLREQITYLEEMEKALLAEIDERGKGIKDLTEAGRNLESQQIEIKQAADLLTRVNDTIGRLTVEQDAPPRVTELEKAAITKVDVERRKQIFTAGATVGAFGLAAFLVGLLELRVRRLDGPNMLPRALGMRVVGTVPGVPRSVTRRPQASASSHWQALLTESVDNTRTMLLHGTGLSSVRVILVTSAVSGEGKTSLASHLAMSMVRSGRRTLLVDGDMRSPVIGRLFRLPEGAGLAEVLRGEVELAAAVQPTPVPGLSILTAGRCDSATIQALSQPGIDRLVAWMKEQFDFVIFDSSPVVPVADTLLLARHTDGVIVSLLQDVSRMPPVEEACRRMATLGIRVLGAVVSGTYQEHYGYGYRYLLPPQA
jgi:polysaccharide biosynthesis transport protein